MWDLLSVRGSGTIFGSTLRALFHPPGSLLRTLLPTLSFSAFGLVDWA
jgi:hypothetical protein